MIAPDPKRFLPVSDPKNRNLYIALGCAAENIVVAADYYGLGTRISDTRVDGRLAILINTETGAKKDLSPDHLIHSIPKRRMNRNAYHDILPDVSFLNSIASDVSDDVRLDVISEKKRKEEIAEIMVDFREKIFDDRDFRGEMVRYKKNNLTSSPLGMTGATMGFGLIQSFIAPFVIKNFNVIRALRKQELRMLNEHTPYVACISTRNDEGKDWVLAGRLFERIALESEHRGIAIAASAVSHDKRQLSDALDTPYYPQIFFRMGYAKEVAPHSPRLPASAVTTLNIR